MRVKILCIFFVCSIVTFAEAYRSDSAEVKKLERLYRSSGLLFPVSAYPISAERLLKVTQKLIQSKQIDTRTQEKARELEAKLINESIPLQARFHLGLAYEYRSFINPQRAEAQNAHETTLGIDFFRFYLSRPPLITLGFKAQSVGGFSLALNVPLAEKWSNDLFVNDNFPTFGPFGSQLPTEYHALERGILYWSAFGLDVAFGRDTAHFGSPQGTSLTVSEKLPYMDQLRLHLPIGPLSFDWMASSLSSYKSINRDVYPNQTNSNTQPPSFGFEEDLYPSTIIYASHRLEYRVKRGSLSVGEQVIYNRRNNFYQIADFIPLSSWHSIDIKPYNTSLFSTLRLLPLKGLEVAFEIGFDDIDAKVLGIGDYDIPLIGGYIGKAAYTKTLESIGQLDTFLELGTTHYLYGNFDAAASGLDTKFVTPLARGIYRYRIEEYGAALLPLTSPYGPGVNWLEMNIALSRNKISSKLAYRVFSINTKANLIDTPYEANPDIENAARTLFQEISFRQTYARQGFSGLIEPVLLIKNTSLGFMCSFLVRFDLDVLLFKQEDTD